MSENIKFTRKEDNAEADRFAASLGIKNIDDIRDNRHLEELIKMKMGA